VLVSSSDGSAVYAAVLDQEGDLNVAVADMDIFSKITPSFVWLIRNQASYLLTAIKVAKFEAQLAVAPMIFIDCNLPSETIEFVLNLAAKHKTPGLLLPWPI
jgi:hypothetical protein